MTPYAVEFHIPISLWQTTVDNQSIEVRAKTRAKLRHMAKFVWNNAKTHGARPVSRYMLLVIVAGRKESPVLACETLKPLIDAGTDAGMWPDDDPFHRLFTGYMQDTRPAPGARPRISVMVIPVSNLRLPHALIPSGASAARLSASFPHNTWLTSNLRLEPQERAARQEAIMKRVTNQWQHIQSSGATSVLVGVRYPDSRADWVGDPDNTAETATAMYGAGVLQHRAPATPNLFGFYLLDGQAQAGSHDMEALILATKTDWPHYLLGLAQ